MTYTSLDTLFHDYFIETTIDIYINLKITPNQVTTLSAICSILVIYNMFYKNKLYCYIFYFLRHYLDCIDGFLARKTGQVTEFGDIYDHGIDRSFGIAFIISTYMLSKTPKLDITIYVISMIIAVIGYSCYLKHGPKDETIGRESLELFKNWCVYKEVLGKGGIIISYFPLFWIIYKL